MSIVTNEVPEIVGLILSNYGVAPSNLFTESSPILWGLVFPPEPFKLTPDCFGSLGRDLCLGMLINLIKFLYLFFILTSVSGLIFSS